VPAAYNAAMRVSLTARLVSRPAIDFGTGRNGRGRARLGLTSGTATYYHHRRQPTVTALRSLTSGFRFPAVGRVGLVGTRRSVPPLGLPRAHRG